MAQSFRPSSLMTLHLQARSLNSAEVNVVAVTDPRGVGPHGARQLLSSCARCKAPVISPALFVGWWARITFFYNLRFDDVLISDLTIDPR